MKEDQYLPNLRFQTSKELFETIPEITEDMMARETQQHSLEYLHDLSISSTPEEALTFASYLLDNRRAVWWGRQCLYEDTDMLSDMDKQMLEYAADWVRQNDEETRNIALENSTNSKLKTPGVWIALAAGWSGGSMTGPDLPPVPPPMYLTPRAVNAGVLGLLARTKTDARKETILKFVRFAIKLIEG